MFSASFSSWGEYGGKIEDLKKKIKNKKANGEIEYCNMHNTMPKRIFMPMSGSGICNYEELYRQLKDVDENKRCAWCYTKINYKEEKKSGK